MDSYLFQEAFDIACSFTAPMPQECWDEANAILSVAETLMINQNHLRTNPAVALFLAYWAIEKLKDGSPN